MKKIRQCGEKWKNKVIHREEFNMKESRRCNVSVSINHHHDSEKGILYAVDNLHTGFNKTGFHKQLLGINDCLYNWFILRFIKSSPTNNLILKLIQIK